MTKIDTSTEAVEALLKDMTEGPWEAALERGCHGVIAHSLPAGGANFVALVGNDPESAEKEPSRFANARFIAASRELVPALLVERDALQAEVDRLKAQADAVWNEAIEAAANQIQHIVNEAERENTQRPNSIDLMFLRMMGGIVSAIRTLVRPTKGETK